MPDVTPELLPQWNRVADAATFPHGPEKWVKKFLAKITSDGDCWIWTGSYGRRRSGYS